MSINPKNLSATARLTFLDDFDTLSLWNGASGTWDTAYFWAPANGMEVTGAGQVNWNINSNYAPTSSVTPWTVSNGILDLYAGPAPAAIQPYINNAQYISGMITSYHSVSQLYGYFEISAELPSGPGMWPAFWLMPTNTNSATFPEIDIMEALGSVPNVAYQTVHTDQTGTMTQVQNATVVPTMYTGFNTYAVDWEPNTITWYIDGVQVFQIATPADMHSPMYMIADLGIYGAGIANATTPVSGNMLIDYIAAYEPTPFAIAITSFSPDSGIVGDGITNATHITLNGTTDPNAVVQVFDRTTLIGTATANASGAWSFATGTLAAGTHPFTAQATDPDGTVSVVSTPLNVTIDTGVPVAPVIKSFSPDSNIVGDGITSADQLTLTGTAVAGNTVEIFDGSTEIGTTAANASGAWSFATAVLANGTHVFTGVAMDVAGNLSGHSAVLDVTVDTIPPAAPDIVSEAEASSTSVIVTGTAEAGSTVRLYQGTQLLGSAVAAGNGNWSINPGTLSAGSHDFTATATDVAGSVSPVSNVLDGIIGPPPVVIEAAGSTALDEVGTNYYLEGIASGAGPELQYGGMAVFAGEFGSWTPIGAVQIATGYEVAFKLTGATSYEIWTTDSNGNYISNGGVQPGASLAIEQAESVFHQDLNGDGVIGINATVIERAGSTSLVELGGNYYFNGANGSFGPELQDQGAPVVAGEFGNWTPIGVEQTSTGYEVAFQSTGSTSYEIWTTDSNGNYVSSGGIVSGTSAALEAAELSFHQDLNGDGVIDTPSTVIEASGNIVLTLSQMTQAAAIDAGATLELTGGDSGSVTFKGATGTLVLDHSMSFTGKLINLTGNGNPTSSDQIDLRDIGFGSGTKVSYSGNSTGGTLTVTDAQNHVAHIALVGNYTNSTFNLASDGQGDTMVIDPPKENFNFASVGSTTSVPAPPPVSIGGAANDAFVFQPHTAAGSGGPAYSAIDGHGSPDGHGLPPEHTSLMATANAAPSNHPWFDEAGPGHVGSFAETHMGHFILH
jgi:beta-glucanase (GH16 family)